jgi:uncharacterized protein (UPF0264 family)
VKNGLFSSPVPRLLVSVRSAQEAETALAGGCDILDVKEPSRGPLGMADRSVIAAVSQVATRSGALCSAACGEAVDFLAAQASTNCDSGFESPISPIEFFKLGSAQLTENANWQNDWKTAYRLAAKQFASSAEHSPSSRSKAVAVVYADWQRAAVPSPHAILDAVAAVISDADPEQPRFVGVLIDTFVKSSGGLLDCLTVSELEEFADRLRTLVADGPRLFLALAGKLAASDLNRLVSVRPDVIAVRSAACRNHDRQSSVDAEVTRQFRAELQNCFSEASTEPPELLTTERA